MYLALKMDLSIILTGADWNQQETFKDIQLNPDEVLCLYHQSTAYNMFVRATGHHNIYH